MQGGVMVQFGGETHDNVEARVICAGKHNPTSGNDGRLGSCVLRRAIGRLAEYKGSVPLDLEVLSRPFYDLTN
jgi:hypothetical protein